MNWKDRFGWRIGIKVHPGVGSSYYHNKDLEDKVFYGEHKLPREVEEIDGDWIRLGGDEDLWFLKKDLVKI